MRLRTAFLHGGYQSFFSDKGCRRAPLFTAPADAARLPQVLFVRKYRHFYLSQRHTKPDRPQVTVYASLSPFSDERPSSRFRGIALPSERRRLRYSTVGLTRYR
ncbi:hypothetical protein, partial [Escherichia coli]|uniref:hypothetical protein n=1 Tax=Escherichia coli TaxID=562 RepID=UPI0013EB6597